MVHSTIQFAAYCFTGFILYLPNLLINKFIRSSDLSLQTKLNNTNLSRQVIIVTGSNTGVGFETAKRLACNGATIILGCRDMKKATCSQIEISNHLEFINSMASERKLYPFAKFGRVECIPLDLASFESVVTFASLVKRSYKSIDVLINNAGVSVSGETIDGMEQLFQVNYLSHFLLFLLLIPLMSSNSSKVINLSSVTHHMGNFSNFHNDESYRQYNHISRYLYYADSKLLLNLFTIEINKRFKSSDNKKIVAISVNPGAVKSDIWRHVPSFVKGIYDAFMTMFYLSVEDGAKTSIYAALLASQDIYDYLSQTALRCNYKDSEEAHFQYHPYLPYIAPYQNNLFGFLPMSFEAIGPFYGPIFSKSSYPKHSLLSSEILWSKSKEICLNQLKIIYKDNSGLFNEIVNEISEY